MFNELYLYIAHTMNYKDSLDFCILILQKNFKGFFAFLMGSSIFLHLDYHITNKIN